MQAQGAVVGEVFLEEKLVSAIVKPDRDEENSMTIPVSALVALKRKCLYLFR